MKAFISWSGSRELLIAQAFKAWLAAVLPEVRSFTSPELPKGRAWFDELARELKDARLGFMCLAPPRVASEWQLLEAGAIWKAARGGGLFPLCFEIGGADLPEPLRGFQLTMFEKHDFQRLARDVCALTGAQWTDARESLVKAQWPVLKQSVEAALQQPDNGVHTTRGFIHAVAGGWWERVWSEAGGTKLSWMSFTPSSDGSLLSIAGRGFGHGGVQTSRWQTDLVAVDALPRQPLLQYYWEGRHPKNPALLFGGKCSLRFTIAANGRIEQGSGEFLDVCLTEARPPTTKLVDLLRAKTGETEIMEGQDIAARGVLAKHRLQTWP